MKFQGVEIVFDDPNDKPDFIVVSPHFIRLFRKEHQRGASWVKLAEETRVELGIPVRSEKAYDVMSDFCWVDPRCLRRYKRKHDSHLRRA